MKKVAIGAILLSLVSIAFSAGMFNSFFVGGGIGVLTLYSTPASHQILGIRAPYINVELGKGFRLGTRVYFSTAKVMPTIYAGFSLPVFKPNNYFALTAKPYAGALVEKVFGDNNLHFGGLAGITLSVSRRFRGGAFNKLEGFFDFIYTYVQGSNSQVVTSLGFQFGM
jgi:hypothetical protein